MPVTLVRSAASRRRVAPLVWQFASAAATVTSLGCHAPAIPVLDGGTEEPGLGPLAVFDTCEAAMASPVVLPSNTLRPLLPFGGCGESPPPSISCLVDPTTGAALPLSGRNFYFGFSSGPSRTGSVAELEKWHVHAHTDSVSQKVALYVLGSCAASQACEDPVNAGIAGAGDTHLSFQVTPNTRYVVVVNTTAVTSDTCDGSQLPSVLLQHDVCGDGLVEHGKTCDSGSQQDGGPTSTICVDCKTILNADQRPVEPNDSPLDANIIRLSNMAPSVRGMLLIYGANAIGYDFFGLQAPPGTHPSTVTASLDWVEEPPASCVSAFLAPVHLREQWFLATNRGYSGDTAMLQPGSAVGSCQLSLTFPFDADPTSTTGLSSYYLRLAATKTVEYHLSVGFNSLGAP